MKMIWIIFVVIAFAGCTKQNSDLLDKKPVTEKHLSDADKITLLRNKAKDMNLRWFIFCVPGGNIKSNYYQAEAKDKNEPKNVEFEEEGAKPWWSSTGSTPAEAAYKLYIKLYSGQPAEHIPSRISEYNYLHKDCDYNTVYDDKHSDEIPCKGGK